MHLRFTFASLVALGAVLFPGAALAKPWFQPGDAGAGDPYFPLDGNGGYDVDHYQLEVRYEPSSAHLIGHASISAHATQNLSRFNLDLDGLDVAQIKVNGRAATWERDGGELIITPSHGLAATAAFEIGIDYAGVPELYEESTGAGGLFHTPEKALMLGEPHGATTWFPANDQPSDRASFTFEVTVPDGFDVVANGVLAGRTSTDGWTTWTWDQTHPMATYLVGIAIGDLSITSYERDGIQYWDAIDADLFGSADDTTPSEGEVATLALARAPEVLDFLADRFGPYPFDAAGGIVIEIDGSFSMETQTRPVYPGNTFGDVDGATRSMAHELAHQWFGDSVTLAAWQHIWLNEGFASYAEWLWSESEGLQTVQDRFDENYARDADDPFWEVTVGDPGPDLLFDDAIYDRGAMTLHQLRQVVGDDTFFDILQAWACVYAGDNVTTDEFIALAEVLSGEDLGSFFDDWLFAPAKPDLRAGATRCPPAMVAAATP